MMRNERNKFSVPGHWLNTSRTDRPDLFQRLSTGILSTLTRLQAKTHDPGSHKRPLLVLLGYWLLCIFTHIAPVQAEPQRQLFSLADVQQLAQSHPGQTGTYVLEYGEEALLARAWLTDHAQHSIEVQYFIWSDDNVGTLAAEALLRAAQRGVKIRVIVDDFMIDVKDKVLLALAKHPNISIRIYNPKHSVGTSSAARLVNLVRDFRGFNQRMHDKTFIVDGLAAITGGRNMADEYYDFDHEYNFRDRDVLLLGKAVSEMRNSFESFWSHPISAPVTELYDGIGIMQKHVTVDDAEIQTIYRELHQYAESPENFAPEVRQAIDEMPNRFPALSKALIWGNARVISDIPGKNRNRFTLGGGGRTSMELASLLAKARNRIVIQSPYLILTDETFELFEQLIDRGVSIRISTNSLSSTDNLAAFGGFRSQRDALLKLGIEIYEYKPNADVQKSLMRRQPIGTGRTPIFAIHAKSLVVDGEIAYIGTFNLDPRSVNLNTETGVIIENTVLARQIEHAITTDMKPVNSWNSARDNPDSYSPLPKRVRTRLMQLMPIKSLL